MFRYSLLINDLLKALTHKYVRRVPKGVTKTGATKYIYYYAGQEGHGHGIAHESELVQGASFAFGEHGKTRYHAHITKVDGDKLTIKYDDGDKKDKEETMTKKEFQALLHGEHSQAIKQAQSKAEKQLQEAKIGKEKGVKFSDKTMSNLEERVKTLQGLTPTQEEKNLEFSEFEQRALDDSHTLLDKVKKEPLTLEKFKKYTKVNPVLYVSANIKMNSDKAIDYLLNTKDLTKYKVIPNLAKYIKNKIFTSNNLGFQMLPPQNSYTYKDEVDTIGKKVLSNLNNKTDVKHMDLYKDYIEEYTSYIFKELDKDPKVQDYNALDTWKNEQNRDLKNFKENSSAFINVAYRQNPEKVADAYLKVGHLKDKIKDIPNIKNHLMNAITKMTPSIFSLGINEKKTDRIAFYDAYKNGDPLDLNHLPMLLDKDILSFQLDDYINDFILS